MWRAENLAAYLTKGKQVYIEGRLQSRSYDDKDGKKCYATDVVAEEVVLLGGQGDNGQQQAANGGQSRNAPPAQSGRNMPNPNDLGNAGGDFPVYDDDIPF